MRIQHHGSGYKELATSGAAHDLVLQYAEPALARANAAGRRSEFGMKSTSGHTRAGAIIYTANPAAMVRNARDNTLIRALYGG